MSHVAIYFCPLSHVTKPDVTCRFKKCRRVEFRGRGPYMYTYINGRRTTAEVILLFSNIEEIYRL